MAKGYSRPENHPKTKKLFVDFLVERTLPLPPWSLGVDGRNVYNVPSAVIINPEIHPWASCTSENRWNLVVKALVTTREESVREGFHKARVEKQRGKKERWRIEEERRRAAGKRERKEPLHTLPRLTPSEKKLADERIRRYCLIDYLYRLRIRANYKDAGIFTDGPEFPGDAIEVRENLLYLASSTLLIHELCILELVGRGIFEGWVNGWVKRNVPPEFERGIELRRHLIL